MSSSFQAVVQFLVRGLNLEQIMLSTKYMEVNTDSKYLPTPFLHSAKPSRIPEFRVRYAFHTRIARPNFYDRTVKIKLDVLNFKSSAQNFSQF